MSARRVRRASPRWRTVPQAVPYPLEGGDIHDGLVASIIDIVSVADLSDVEWIGEDPGDLAAAELAERTSRSSIRWPIVVFDELLGIAYRLLKARLEPPGVGCRHHCPDRAKCQVSVEDEAHDLGFLLIDD